MNNKFLTPLQLWQDFNPIKEGLDISYIGIEKKDGLIYKSAYYTAETDSNNEKARIHAHVICQDNNRKKPIIIVVGDINKSINEVVMREVAEAGYLAIGCDYSCVEANEEKATKYPETMQNARYEVARNNLYNTNESIANSCWYIWAKVIRRLIAVASVEPKADADNIGILGIKRGTYMAWQIASMDGRIKAMASVLGHELGKYKDNSADNLDPSTVNWKAGVAAESYAKFMTTPVLTIFPTNSKENNIDNLSDLMQNLPEETEKTLVLEERRNNHITKSAMGTLKRWFGNKLKNTDFPTAPELNICPTPTGIVYSIKADTSKTIKQVKLCYSYNEETPAFRNWIVLEVTPQGELYSGTLDLTESSKYRIFASVLYSDCFFLSTPIETYSPIKQNISSHSAKKSYILYDSKQGVDCFTSVNDSLEILENNDPFLEKCENGIYGITTNNDGVITYKIGDITCLKETDSTLQIDVHSLEDVEVRIIIETVNENNEILQYYEDCAISSAIEWSKLSLDLQDFKTDKMISLKSWAEAKSLIIKSGKKILLNNILFV